MFVLIGFAVVTISVLGGYMLHGGPLAVLVQPSEFIIIGGAALGSLIVATPPGLLKQLTGQVIRVLKGDPYSREAYLDLLKTMFALFNVASRDGLITIEQHVERPESSSIFAKNAFLLSHHHALTYFTDTMKLLLGGGVPPHDLEALLEADMETHHAESAASASMIQKLSDSLPGLGIVAAVLGIVITMQAIEGPPAEIGMKVAAALVGTFLGVLLAYGFVGPVASHMEVLSHSESQFYNCIKVGLVAFAKGNSPIIVVEFARRSISNDLRPSFLELEQAVKSLKAL